MIAWGARSEVVWINLETTERELSCKDWAKAGWQIIGKALKGEGIWWTTLAWDWA